MKRWYARAVLWLITPALEEKSRRNCVDMARVGALVAEKTRELLIAEMRACAPRPEDQAQGPTFIYGDYQ